MPKIKPILTTKVLKMLYLCARVKVVKRKVNVVNGGRISEQGWLEIVEQAKSVGISIGNVANS